MIRASIHLRVSDHKVSQSIVQAVRPDNLKMDRLRVLGRSSPYAATFAVAYDGPIETFIFTLDDLLRCLQAARDTLESVTRGVPTNVKSD
jgi:hypothetical protein